MTITVILDKFIFIFVALIPENQITTQTKSTWPMKNWWQPSLLICLTIVLASTLANAQEEKIVLRNPSFEDMPRHSYPPRYWSNCGFDNESPPDVQPDFTFGVSKLAEDGNTYLGMVVRDNDTWEAVGQVLAKPLQGGQCYSFSIHLARSLNYLSVSREHNEPANYITPAKLRIWAGYGMCDKRGLLGETDVVKHNDWRQYDVKLEPDENYTHIIFEVFYNTPTLFPYNGNLLLDNASELVVMPCDEPLTDPTIISDDPIVVVDPPVTPRGPDTPSTSPNTPTSEPETTTIFGVTKDELVKDLKIEMENVDFTSNSSELLPGSEKSLDDLYTFLKSNPEVIIEIGGHTNGLADRYFADQLSTERAKAVADYLTSRGIAPIQCQYRGYGKRIQIATNDTEEGRRKNQRVEVKILAIIQR